MFSASFWKYIKKHKELTIDFVVIFFVLIFSIILVSSKVEEKILGNFVGFEYIPYFLAGVFSVNFITAFPAYTFLAKVVTPENFWLVTTMGAIGSVVGDTLIFSFIKFRLLESMIKSFKHNRLVISILKTKNHILKYLLILVGCLIIMSPLPDEFGVLLIGLSRIKHRHFIILSLMLNSLGTYLFLRLFLH
jgi:hypothetical protein